jgi:large subunit ribosomal protein L30
MSPDKAKSDKSTEAYLLVKQVRSGIGTKPKHRQTLRALGLRGIGREHVLPDTPDVRGMIERVPHLVTVGTPTKEQTEKQQAAQASALQARRAGRGGSQQ